MCRRSLRAIAPVLLAAAAWAEFAHAEATVGLASGTPASAGEVALTGGLAGGAAASAARGGFRCDGTDPLFFEELERAGTVGYGETWDETLCDEGLEIYADGAGRRWRALQAPRGRPPVSDEEQMLALVMPAVVVGGMGAVFLAAAALAASSRMRKRVVLEVPCPACGTALPIAVDDVLAHQLFCPMCGGACAVEVRGKGRDATGVARLLA